MEWWSIGKSNRYELRVACSIFQPATRNPQLTTDADHSIIPKTYEI